MEVEAILARITGGYHLSGFFITYYLRRLFLYFARSDLDGPPAYLWALSTIRFVFIILRVVGFREDFIGLAPTYGRGLGYYF